MSVIMTTYDDTLRAALERSRMSPYRLARGANVDPSTVNRWYRGKSGLTSRSMQRMLDFLELQIVLVPKSQSLPAVEKSVA